MLKSMQKNVMREKYFYIVFEIHCVLCTYSTPQFDQMRWKFLNMIDNPGFTVLLVRTFMGARE